MGRTVRNKGPVGIGRAKVGGMGAKLLAKMGWKEGSSLGAREDGLKEPIRHQRRQPSGQGLGHKPSTVDNQWWEKLLANAYGPPKQDQDQPVDLFAACEGRRCRPHGTAKLARIEAHDQAFKHSISSTGEETTSGSGHTQGKLNRESSSFVVVKKEEEILESNGESGLTQGSSGGESSLVSGPALSKPDCENSTFVVMKKEEEILESNGESGLYQMGPEKDTAFTESHRNITKKSKTKKKNNFELNDKIPVDLKVEATIVKTRKKRRKDKVCSR